MRTMETKQPGIKRWLRRVGFWGFMFFLVKGLIWLALGYFVIK